MQSASERVILALDVPDFSSVEQLVDSLLPELKYVKVGPILFGSEGPSVIKKFTKRGVHLFLDLKFHDIPNTVAGAIHSVMKAGNLAFLTIHSSGGPEMIQAARKAVDESQNVSKPKLLAVTVLTSLTSKLLQKIGFQITDSGMLVEKLGAMALEAGADGLVCSPLEVARLRKVLPSSALLVVPGIRPEAMSGKDDQKRIATPKQAIEDGASYLVIGRPITQASDPRGAFHKIVQEISS